MKIENISILFIFLQVSLNPFEQVKGLGSSGYSYQQGEAVLKIILEKFVQQLPFYTNFVFLHSTRNHVTKSELGGVKKELVEKIEVVKKELVEKIDENKNEIKNVKEKVDNPKDEVIKKIEFSIHLRDHPSWVFMGIVILFLHHK